MASTNHFGEQKLVKESLGKEFGEQILKMAEPNKEALYSSGLCVPFKTLSLLYAFTKAGEIIITHLSCTGVELFWQEIYAPEYIILTDNIF